ncbi:MAG: preprotein translocase subunit SecY [Syntrophobacterales bacterium]|jgi:preprotein translocase subunit SecY|nr:preprotein translocase subunit SecY [Syntrophobacterales bacterium]
MRRFIESIKNIWSIEELRKRIIYTLGIILIYRLGSYVVIPGVDPTALTALKSQSSEGLLGLLNMFSGGAFANASIFALGVMPYITASIIVQLLGMALPYFQKLQKEGESGRKKMNQITRYLTIIVCVFQAPAYITNMRMQAADAIVLNNANGSPSMLFWISALVILISGTLFIMWLGERITEKGIGNGISMIIMIGIIARLPFALFAEFASRMEQQGGGLVFFILEIAVLIIVILLCILLVQGTRRIPVQYAKRVVGNKQYGGVRQYIPIKVNAAGVMPIIFAQAIMFLPLTIVGFAVPEGGASWLYSAINSLVNVNGFTHNLIFFLMIVVFTYFYTAITINPQQMADDIKKNGGFIPGIKPGKKTAEYIDTIISRITLPGSFFLGIVAILPAIITMAGVTSEFSRFYGGTSLLIMVGVFLDTLSQIESQLLMRHYDGLLKEGRIKGRSGS